MLGCRCLYNTPRLRTLKQHITVGPGLYSKQCNEHTLHFQAGELTTESEVHKKIVVLHISAWIYPKSDQCQAFATACMQSIPDAAVDASCRTAGSCRRDAIATKPGSIEKDASEREVRSLATAKEPYF